MFVLKCSNPFYNIIVSMSRSPKSLYNKRVIDLCFLFLVNYRGSLGFGQTSLHSLPGNIGTQDVQDVQVSLNIPLTLQCKCVCAVKSLKQQYLVCLSSQRAATKVLESKELDRSNVFVMGGSHGGFLTGHLIGQYPVRLTYWLVTPLYRTFVTLPYTRWRFLSRIAGLFYCCRYKQ